MSPFYCPPPLGRLLKPAIARRLAPRPLSVRFDVYNTYGQPTKVIIRGRALEKKSTDIPLTIADSWWTNLKRTWHALESDEIKNLDLVLSFEGQDYTVCTDEEGLFSLEITPPKPLSPGVYEVTARLPPQAFHNAQAITARIFILPVDQPSLGVISDIDDTILHTHLTHWSAMVKALVFNNGLTAQAIPGMAAVYHGLAQAGFGFHYLSGSPINLHQRLRSFLEHRGFPEGSMELRHWGIGPGTDAILSSSTYKLQRLQTLFQGFPQRQFLLIGDNGQKDPEIYATLQKTFPKQVLGIAIHNLKGSLAEAPPLENMTYFEDSQALERYLSSLKSSLPSLQKAPKGPSPNLSA